MKLPMTTNNICVSLKRLSLVLTAGIALGIGKAGASAPPNDDFTNAIALSGDAGSLPGNTTVGATLQTGEPVCGYDTTTNTVWFKWTCTTSGMFTLSTTGSTNPDSAEWDAVVGVYTGTALTDLVLVPDLANGNPQDTGYDEIITLPVTSGSTYYFQLGGDSGAPPQDATNILLTWSLVIPPPPTVIDISNATTPVLPSNTGAGVNINNSVGTGNTGRLIGTTQTYWGSGGATVPLDLNGNSLIIDSGNGNNMTIRGPISGNGTLIFQSSGNNPMHVSGANGNTYTGTTTISNAIVSLEKSSGNALQGTITLNNTAARLNWAASNQISDDSDVTLSASSAVLNLAGNTDTINNLHLVTGSSVNTGVGGILKVAKLFINGIQQPEVAYIVGDGYVLGSGYIEVGASGPPIIASAPVTPAAPVPTDGLTNVNPAFLAKLDWADCAEATSFDVYLVPATDPDPVPGITPVTANVALSEYTLSPQVLSLTSYKWMVVAKNSVGTSPGPLWTFTTLDRRDISGSLTMNLDAIVGAGPARLIGDATTIWWGTTAVSSVDLNGHQFTINTGGGNPQSYNGAITGPGTLRMQGRDDASWYPDMLLGGTQANTPDGVTINKGRVVLNKTDGVDALAGPITVNPGGGQTVIIQLLKGNQINDASTITSTGGAGRFSLVLGDFNETISGLTIKTGDTINTGSVTGGVLTVGALTVNGSVMPSGTYTASDSTFVTGIGSVVVPGAGSPYQIWAAANAGGQSASEDFDHDGVANGLKYFMGAAGTISGANPPVVTAGSVRTVTWPRDPAATVSSWKVQVSDDLATWNDVVPPNASIDTTDPTKVIYTLPGGAKQFCRLSVTP